VTGSLVSPAMRDRVRGFATPIATGLGRLGLTPNALTVIGFVGTCVAAWAAASQLWLLAGILVLAFGIFDLFDGTLARATGRASKLGAFLDSTFDRAGEGIVYLGIAVGSVLAGFELGALLAASAMAAAFMVSYTRAKSESLGFTPGTGMANIGIAPREVRILILAAALVVADLAGGIAEPLLYLETIDLPFGITIDAIRGREYLTLGLALITILATLTTIQRILHVRAQSREG
jgi:CDP-diacylglycerol---glycerol-3-phosphate 3-phosphatidyltransferase